MRAFEAASSAWWILLLSDRNSSRQSCGGPFWAFRPGSCQSIRTWRQSSPWLRRLSQHLFPAICSRRMTIAPDLGDALRDHPPHSRQRPRFSWGRTARGTRGRPIPILCNPLEALCPSDGRCCLRNASLRLLVVVRRPRYPMQNRPKATHLPADHRRACR